MSCPSCVATECPETCTCQPREGEIRLALDLPFLSADRDASIVIQSGSAGLADVVPLVRALVDTAVARTCPAGDEAECTGDGCAMIALSVPEAFAIAREVQALPIDQLESVAAAFHQATTAMLSSPPPPEMGFAARPEKLWEWYAERSLGCPLRHEGRCILPEAKPLACRLKPADGNVPRVDDALARFAARMEDTAVDGMLLPMLFAWLGQNLHRHRRQWDAQELYTALLETLREL
jgi:hypothetical protein